MNKAIKINLVIFLILLAFTLIFNIIKYKGAEDLSLIFMVLFFNLCLGLLIILAINKIIKISSNIYPIFLFYLILTSFTYWYVMSIILNIYYGTFLSIGGLYYFIATRTYSAVILFYIISGILIFSTSFVLAYLSKKYILEGEKPKKRASRKAKIMLVLIPFFILILIFTIIPIDQAYKASPIIEGFTQIIWGKPPAGVIDTNVSISGDKILDLSLKKQNPNIIIIMLESISAERINPYGYERNVTPNIAEFSEKAITFNNTYSTSSHSDYSQPALLSSRYLLTNPYRNFFDIDYPRTFIWDTLKENNYTTLYISSQDDNWANMIDYYNKETLDVYSYSLTDGEYDYIGGGNERKDYDENTATKVINQLNETKDPFFLYVNLQSTHYPYIYQTSLSENNTVFSPDNPSVLTTYFNIMDDDYNASVNRYDNSLRYVDKQVGLILDYLEDNDLFNDSIIVITSDHGESLESRNGNLRHGFGVYEEEVRVPLLIHFPETKPRLKPQLITERVRHIDVVPTILDIANFSLSKEFQGRPMVTNQEVFIMAQNQNFKLGLVKDDIKYILDGLNYKSEIYNLTADPQELNNLAKDPSVEARYYYRYGYILYRWYNCQMKYYQKAKYESNKTINCN